MRGLCPGDDSITCCLPPAQPVSCESNGIYGTCVASGSCSGTPKSGICSDSTQTCCLTSSTASCTAQGQTGTCTNSCSSGNSVAGVCSDASVGCCLPTASGTPTTQSCSAQSQTGVCQSTSATCTSGNKVSNVCANNNVCCLPNKAPATTSCTLQGMTGTCQSVSSCTSGNTFAGLCPGDSTIQCCLPKPPSYGSCTTSTGQVGDCHAGTCSGTVFHNLCPGPATVTCCVTATAPVAAPSQNYGSCAVPNNSGGTTLGTCQSISTCSTTPVPGYCPGPNNIQCCPSGGAAPAPVYASATSTAGLYGNCQSGTSVGTCKVNSACSGTVVANLCPGPANIECCVDGGIPALANIDLPGGKGVAITSLLTSAAASCLVSGGFKFVLIRGWLNTCQIDPNVVASLKAAHTAGLGADVVLFPSAWCGVTAKAQALQLVSAIASLSFGRIFISVEAGSGWSATTQAANLQWLLDATAAISGAIGSARVGLISTAAGYSTVIGTATSAKLTAFPLMYAGSIAASQSNTDFSDFNSGFGGFLYAYAKRINTATAICSGLIVDIFWMPLHSTNTATPGSKPANEAQGSSCTVNGVQGYCQSTPDICPGSTSARGYCGTTTKVCCLTAAPAQPTPVPDATIPISYGNCVVNSTTTGVCQPSAFCGATDAKIAGVAGCVADPSTTDADVTCCVPVGGVAPPPSDDSVADPPAYDPYLYAVPSGKDAVPSRTISRVSKAAASTTAVNPASRVCVNKAGLALIESFEGFRATFYNDAVGIKTIGFGTACHAYPCDTLHPPLTRAQAEQVMLADMNAHYAPCVRNFIRVPLNSNQFSALTSFVYNTGCGALSESVGTQLNEGCYSCVRANLMKWVRGGNTVLPGLVRRRSAEADLFENHVVSGCLDGSGGTGSTTHEGQSWGSCSSGGKTGDCITETSCDGTVVHGLCPGPSTIACCLAKPPNPPTPPKPSCGNGGHCMTTTSCNTGSNIVRHGLCAGPADVSCPAATVPVDCFASVLWHGTHFILPLLSLYVPSCRSRAANPRASRMLTAGGMVQLAIFSVKAVPSFRLRMVSRLGGRSFFTQLRVDRMREHVAPMLVPTHTSLSPFSAVCFRLISTSLL